MARNEVETLLQPGRVSMGLASGRSSLASAQAPPSCRPSFAPSRSMTPRQSGVSAAPPNFTRVAQEPGGFLGGIHGDDDSSGLGRWYALTIAVVLVYCIVWLLPNCFSCATSAATDLAFDSTAAGSTPPNPWSSPSNDQLSNSLPNPSSAGFDLSPPPAPPTPPAPEAPQQLSAPEATATEAWRFPGAEDLGATYVHLSLEDEAVEARSF